MTSDQSHKFINLINWCQGDCARKLKIWFLDRHPCMCIVVCLRPIHTFGSIFCFTLKFFISKFLFLITVGPRAHRPRMFTWKKYFLEIQIILEVTAWHLPLSMASRLSLVWCYQSSSPYQQTPPSDVQGHSVPLKQIDACG